VNAYPGFVDEEDFLLSAESLGDKIFSMKVHRVGAMLANGICHKVEATLDQDVQPTLDTLVRAGPARILLDLQAYDALLPGEEGEAEITLALDLKEATSMVGIIKPGSRTEAQLLLSREGGEWANAEFQVTNVGPLWSPDILTARERCRLLRQLSKACYEEGTRKRSLLASHPHVCEAAGDVFQTLGEEKCVENGGGAAMHEAVSAYVSRNLALLEIAVVT